MSNRRQRIYFIAFIGVLVAVNIVLSRFLSVNLWSNKIGFAFITLAIAARLYGPIPAMLVGGLGDLLGAVLFPIGPYNPGFTLTAVLTGLCMGLFFRGNTGFVKVLTSTLITNIGGTVFLNTLWIAQMYGKGYMAILPGRITQAVIMTVVETAALTWLFTRGDKLLGKLKIKP